MVSELTLAKLHNRMRSGEEENVVVRNLIAAIAMNSDANKGITTLLSGITDNNGGFGTYGDLLRMGNTANDDLVEEDDERRDRACLKAIDSTVISQEGNLGDLWMFVIEASDGKKIAVSGWAY